MYTFVHKYVKNADKHHCEGNYKLCMHENRAPCECCETMTGHLSWKTTYSYWQKVQDFGVCMVVLESATAFQSIIWFDISIDQ